MKSAWPLSLSTLVAVAFCVSAWAQGQGTDFSKIEILTEKIAPNLYLLVRFGRFDLRPPGCRGRQDRHPRRPGRHLHGRCPICAAHRQSRGGDQKNQPRTDAFSGQYTHTYRSHGRQCELCKNGSYALCARRAARRNVASPAFSQWQPGSRQGSGWSPYGDIWDGRAGEIPHERRNRRSDSGSSSPYRWRYDDQVRECERDHDRRFLPKLRLSLHRHAPMAVR